MDRPFLANLSGAAAVLFLLFVPAPSCLFAQSTATVLGTVTDPTGAVVQGATVVVQNQGTGLRRTMTTNSSGSFEFPELPIGAYEIKGNAQGMRSEVLTGLLLQVSQIVVKNIRLEVAHTSEVITVSSEAPVIDAGTMTVGEVINQRTVQDI